MNAVSILAFGLVQSSALVGALYAISLKKRGDARGALSQMEEQLTTVTDLKGEFVKRHDEMVPIEHLAEQALSLKSVQESLKVERGRITITKAELETVENRLRELEEIERELEASGVETKEELKILEKKEREARERNDALKERIKASMAELDRVLGEIEMSAQVQGQIEGMKTELLRTQQQIDTLILQIELSNEGYMILKKRYDALDIEYAQLYEKFAEVEAPAGN